MIVLRMLTLPLFLGALLAGGTIVVLVVQWMTGAARARIDRRRRRPKRGLIFGTAFTLYALALIVFLAAGFVPAIVRNSPSLHARLHRAGGTTELVRLAASEYSFDQAQLTVPANRLVTVLFTNRHTGVEHNVAVYGSSDDPGDDDFTYGTQDVYFSSKGYVGKVTREFYFGPLTPGIYSFQCDVEDPDPEIGNHARYMVGTLMVEWAPPRPEPGGPLGQAQRGIASAFHYSEGLGEVALDYLFSILALALGIYLVKRRPLDRVARLFGVGMLGTAVAYNIQTHAALDVVPGLANFLHPFIVHFVSGVVYVYAVILFPDGRLVPALSGRIKRAALAAGLFYLIVFSLGASGLFEPRPGAGHAVAFVQAFGILVPAFGVAAQGYRFRRATTPEARQQSKILLWAFVPALAFGVAVVLLRSFAGPAGFSGPRETELERLAFRVFQPGFILIPIALIVGILRYRMWHLDVVINRAILYGSLAAFIGGVYVAVVVGIGNAVGGSNPVPAIAATILVAVAFGPLRERVQRIANRLVYGPRATPYEAMAAFSNTLAAAVSTEDVLPRMAEAAARGVGAVRGRVTVYLPDGAARSVEWPAPGSTEFDRTIPVMHEGALIGEISVAKAPGDPVTAGDEELLAALAEQARPALQSVRLTEQLHDRLSTLSAQAKELALSRHRIVTAQDAERRRLQQDISEGVETELFGIRRALARTERMMRSDPAKSVVMLDGITERTSRALETLRDLARGIFPPLLVDRGIRPAIEAQLRKFPLPASFEVAGELAETRFDPHAEAAVYFCCVESLRIASKRSRGVPISLRLSREGEWVEFVVHDPQPLPDSSFEPALQRMTDRVEALGGTFEAHVDPSGARTLIGRVPARPAPVHAGVGASGPNTGSGM